MIVSIKYRFLRLSADRLALVEIHPNTPVPQPTTCIYPHSPYLTSQRLKFQKEIFRGNDELWIAYWKKEFDLAVKEAEEHFVIDYQDKIGKNREVILWNYLDPLEEIKWDEYAPLFDNDLNLILRESQ